MPIIIAVVVIGIALVAFYFVTYNKLVESDNITKESFATMDVYLKKRWDMIPNIVESVKGYAKHESETLTNVIAARNKPYGDMSYEEKLAANKEVSSQLSRLLVVAEQYPELKASTLFVELTDSLKSVENDISNARKYYNATIRDYNNLVRKVPTNIVASIAHFKEKEMFEIAEAERENVQVKF